MDKGVDDRVDSEVTTRDQQATDIDRNGTGPSTQDGSLVVISQPKSHLWDPLRLSKAQLFASNTTRLLSLSRSISQSRSTELLDPSVSCVQDLTERSRPVESDNIKYNIHSSSPTSDESETNDNEDELMLPHPISVPELRTEFTLQSELCAKGAIKFSAESGTSTSCGQCLNYLPHQALYTHPTKTRCLKLIDKIWKGGLDYNLELIRQRNRVISQQFCSPPDTHSCIHCTELRQRLFSESTAPNSTVAGISGDMQCGADDRICGQDLCDVSMDLSDVSSLATHGSTCTVSASCGRLRGATEILPKEPPKVSKEEVSLEPGQGQTLDPEQGQTLDPEQGQTLDPRLVHQKDSSDVHSLPPPFKKARYSWQVKNKGKCETTVSSGKLDMGLQNPCGSSVDPSSLGGLSGTADDCGDPDPTDSPSPDIGVEGSDTTGDVSRSSDDMEVFCQNIEKQSHFNDCFKDTQEASSGSCEESFSGNHGTKEGEEPGNDQSKNNKSPDMKTKSLSVRKLEPSARQQKTTSRCPETAAGHPQRLSTEVYPSRQRLSTEVYPSRQRRPSNRDFHMLTQALTQLDYVERWQCQHVAKAIVDNAINKTLEEMGLSPDTNARAGYTEQRSRIEDAGVSQAILSRGLRRYSPNSYRMRRLNPIINRLTRVSEHLFSDNLRGSLRSMNEAVGSGENPLEGEESDAERESMGEMEVPPQMLDLFPSDDGAVLPRETDANNVEPESPNVANDTTSTVVEDTRSMDNILTEDDTKERNLPSSPPNFEERPTSQTDREDSCSMLTEKTDDFLPNQMEDKTESFSDCSPGRGTVSAVVAIEESEELPDCTLSQKPVDHPLVLTNPSSNFILDQAVNAVIFERGLQF